MMLFANAEKATGGSHFAVAAKTHFLKKLEADSPNRCPDTMKKLLYLFPLAFLSCYEADRNCADFKTGTFEFITEINGVKKTTTFVRTENQEIDYFEGKADTSVIRWVNDCEYVVQKLRPKNQAEKQGIAMKILTTSKNSYTFEYGIVGSANVRKGTVTKIK